MKIKQAPLSKFVKINPEGITQGYPYQAIEYIDISSVGSGQLVEEPEEILLKDAPSRAKRIVRNKDIILATVRPNLRSFLFIKNPNDNTVVSTGFAVLRIKESFDPRYIYYAITDKRFTGYLTNNTKGTSYPAVDSDIVLRGDIPDFDFNRQKYIGEILSGYDDLIDTNRRRIQLLEKAARLLFREWFVYFRFPGHEKVKIVDGVPAGWAKGFLEDSAIVKKGRNITFEHAVEGDIPVVGGGLEPTYYHNKANVSAPVITISASGANAGYVNMYDTDIWASDCSYIDKNSTKYIYSLYLRLKSLQTTILGFQVGVAQPHVYPRDLNRLKLLMAPDDLCVQFEQLVISIFNLIKNLKLENQKLAQARDLLLPRLMSGAIEV